MFAQLGFFTAPICHAPISPVTDDYIPSATFFFFFLFLQMLATPPPAPAAVTL